MLAGVDGTARHLLVRIAAELDRKKIIGFVVTFDDITELLSAPRKAAWADGARRIAHEIKNPLTPLQLAAERLRIADERDLDAPLRGAKRPPDRGPRGEVAPHRVARNNRPSTRSTNPSPPRPPSPTRAAHPAPSAACRTPRPP